MLNTLHENAQFHFNVLELVDSLRVMAMSEISATNSLEVIALQARVKAIYDDCFSALIGTSKHLNETEQ